MLTPCDPEATVALLQLALERPISELDVALVIDLTAQLVVDLAGPEPHPPVA